MRKVRKWVWAPFTNPARKDNAVFYHWKRLADESKEYPFAQFNKVSLVFTTIKLCLIFFSKYYRTLLHRLLSIIFFSLVLLRVRKSYLYV